MTDPSSAVARALVEAKEAAILRDADKRTVVAAALISVMVAASSGRTGVDLIPIMIVMLAGSAANLALNLAARRKLVSVRTIELARAAVNTVFSAVFGHVAHWPLAAFGWLIYCAFVSQLLGQWGVLRLVIVGGSLDVTALIDGVDPSIVLVFSGLAGLVFFMGTAHVKALREVMLRSIESQLDLEGAHAEIAASATLAREEMRLRGQMEVELRHAQKLESVGRLAAGVAHEINTPIQFVGDSIEFLKEAVAAQFALRAKYRAVIAAGLTPSSQQAELDAADVAADVGYFQQHLVPAFDRIKDGLKRVATIVRAMKEFAHADQNELAAADLNRAIESTLTIARHEYNHTAELETDFGELPNVTCAVGEINQAVLNIVVNAAHAMGDRYKGTDRKGVLKVSTRREGDTAVISIGDDGGGIPLEIRDRVFDPFFTTKPVGSGTGQGLAIARSVIVNRHQGSLTFDVDEVRGTTTFFIRLPVYAAAPHLPRV